MANFLGQSNKNMKRLESRKSHSWWWDGHINPKNSKWLSDNLEEMDQRIKRMLKLIEEDADSFAKKAEMYYEKRPVLISHVEEFYRMYRSLAERYDHVTGELRKNIPYDLQSQGSGFSDNGSEPSSTLASPDLRLVRRKSGPRAAGFDFFLGPGGCNSDTYQKEGDEMSTLTDSDLESDDSSVNNYCGLGFMSNGVEHGLNRKVMELEIELREMKEKLQMKQDENGDGSFRGERNHNSEDWFCRMVGYEEELKIANEKVKHSEAEITRLKEELEKYQSVELTDDLQAGFQEADQNLLEEFRVTKGRLRESVTEISRIKLELEKNVSSEEKVRNLQSQLELSKKDTATWKAKQNAEKREVSKLQERISRLKASLSDRDHEIRDLKAALSDAEEKIFPEKAQVKAEISRLSEEQTHFKEEIREWESRGRYLEEEIRKVKGEKAEAEERLNSEITWLKADISDRVESIENLNKNIIALNLDRDELKADLITISAETSRKDQKISKIDEQLQQLHMQQVALIAETERAQKPVEELRSRVNQLEEEIDRQRIVIMEGAEEKREAIRQLCFSLEHYRNDYNALRKAFGGHHKRVPVLAS